MRKLCCAALAGIVAVALLSPDPVLADENSDAAPEGALAEVVVTAQKRSENIQNVPITVTAVGAATLDNAHITNLGDLPNLVPALQIAQNTDTFNIFMRGIGNPATAIGDEASVAVYIDGVYYPRLPPALFELNNIDHVEVLEGPQGTLFGRNATGGLIQIITKDPSSTPTLHVDAGYGNFETFTGNVYASTGFGDLLAGDIALHDSHMGQGWGTNLYNGTNFGWLDAKAARTKWVFKPVDGTKITLALDYSDSQSTESMLSGLQARGFTHGASCGATCTPFTQPNNVPYPYYGFYNENDDGENSGNDISQGGSLKLEQELPFAKLVSLTAARHQFGSFNSDPDYSPQPWFESLLPYRVQSFSQELQLISKPGSPFDWTVGLYYIDMRSKYDPIRFIGAEWENAFSLPEGEYDIYSSETVNSYAAYTQETFHLTSDTNLTAGLRYTLDKVRATGHNDIVDETLGVDINTGTQYAEQDFNKVTYRIALDHHFTDDVMSYVSYNRGFKAGTYNILPFSAAPNSPAPPVNPEVVDAYELGVKTDLLDHRVRLSADVFYNKVNNLQVQTVRPVGNPPAQEVFETNAAQAKSKGIELNIEGRISEQLSAHLSSTIQDPYYSSYPDAGKSVPAPDGIGTVLVPYDATGQQLVYSPKFAFNLGFDYRLPTRIGAWGAGVDYAFTSGFPFNPDQVVNNGSVGLLNARVSYVPANLGQHWKILFWGKNLTDKQYLNGSQEQNNRSGEVVTPAAPRTFGFTLNYDL
jgi:iron complex outermembrane recepter protein